MRPFAANRPDIRHTGFGDCDCDDCYPPQREYPLADHDAAKRVEVPFIRWATVVSLVAVVVSLSAFASAGTAVWWALALDAFSVAVAVVWIIRGFA